MLLADDERRYVAGNRAVRAFLGVSRTALVASRIDDYTTPDAREQLDRTWHAFLSQGTMEGVSQMVLPNGLERTVLFRAKANIRPGRHLTTLQAARSEHRARRYQDSRAVEISFREREVLTLLARGATIAVIADETSLSLETVRTHARNAMRKLGAHSRPHAVALAINRRYIDP